MTKKNKHKMNSDKMYNSKTLDLLVTTNQTTVYSLWKSDRPWHFQLVKER